MRIGSLVAVVCGGALLSGCNTTDSRLVFGKVNTFGGSISATAPDQGGNVVIGYRSANIAVVPVATRDANGTVVPVFSAQRSNTQQARDAFSTFAHFEAGAGGTGRGICLGDTFATGLAAQRVAQTLQNVCR